MLPYLEDPFSVCFIPEASSRPILPKSWLFGNFISLEHWTIKHLFSLLQLVRGGEEALLLHISDSVLTNKPRLSFILCVCFFTFKIGYTSSNWGFHFKFYIGKSSLLGLNLSLDQVSLRGLEQNWPKVVDLAYSIQTFFLAFTTWQSLLVAHFSFHSPFLPCNGKLGFQLEIWLLGKKGFII